MDQAEDKPQSQGRSLEEVAEMEGGTSAKKAKSTPKAKPKRHPESPTKGHQAAEEAEAEAEEKQASEVKQNPQNK